MRLDEIIVSKERPVKISIGAILYISATCGAKIEQNRASKLQTPIAVAENKTGKRAELLL